MQEKTFPKVTEEKVNWGDANPAKGYKAIVNPDTGNVYSLVTDKYKLIRHEDAAQKAESAIHDKPDLGPFEIITEFYGPSDARMRRTYRFLKIGIEIEQDDFVHLELQLFNSYDCTWPFIMVLGAFRYVCSNGLTVGKEYFRLKRRHVFDPNEINFKVDVSNAFFRFNEQTNSWRRWAERPLTPQTYNDVMQTMDFGLEATEEIHNAVYEEAEGLQVDYFAIMSLWVFYNILTRYITHRTVSLNHRVEFERRLRKSMRYFKLNTTG